MTVQELQAQHDTALATAESLISAVERQKRPLTRHEQQTIDTNLKTAGDLKPRIAAATPARPRTTAEMRALIDAQPRERITRPAYANDGRVPLMPPKFSWDYFRGFMSYLSGAGPLNASLQEGVSTSGGYAVPIVVDGNVVPLAPQDSAVRRLATVIPTQSDIKTAQVNVRGAVTAKAETSSFAVAVPSLGQFELSAYAAGVHTQTSLEFAQDVTLFKTFVLDDAESAFLEYEEPLFISGTGIGQPQGMLGNVGAGITAEPDTNGNLVSVDAVWQLIATLKDKYARNASFLLSRTTALGIRRAQVQSGLFEPIFRRENGVDLLAGFPAQLSSAMPTAARGACPVLFGDFSKGYLIGDRGGSALMLKVLDQAGAAQGLVDLLFYRRTDGRVRVAEAVQSLNIAAS